MLYVILEFNILDILFVQLPFSLSEKHGCNHRRTYQRSYRIDGQRSLESRHAGYQVTHQRQGCAYQQGSGHQYAMVGREKWRGINEALPTR